MGLRLIPAIAGSPDEPGKPPASRQIIGLDLIRFAAAMLVVIYHVALVAWASPQSAARQIADVEPRLVDWWPVAWVGFIGVQIFFVISGFIIAYSAERARAFDFLKGRFLRLAPALWIAAATSLLIFLSFGLRPPSEALGLFAREAMLHPVGPWLNVVVWTLGIELSFYALVFGLLLIGRFRWIPFLATVLTILSLSYHVSFRALECGDLQQITPDICDVANTYNRYSQLLLINHGCYFALGIFLWLATIKKRGADNLWWAVAALGACSLQIMKAVDYNRRMPWFDAASLDAASSYVLAIAVWSLGMAAMWAVVHWNDAVARRVGPIGARAVRFVGLATYPLYLVHYVFSGVVAFVALRLGAPLWLAILLCILAALAFSGGVAVAERQLRRFLSRVLSVSWSVLRSRLPRRALGRPIAVDES